MMTLLSAEKQKYNVMGNISIRTNQSKQAPRASYCNEIKSQGPQGLKTDKMLWQISITEFVFYAMNVISHLPIVFRIILTSKFKSILARFCPAEDT